MTARNIVRNRPGSCQANQGVELRFGCFIVHYAEDAGVCVIADLADRLGGSRETADGNALASPRESGARGVEFLRRHLVYAEYGNTASLWTEKVVHRYRCRAQGGRCVAIAGSSLEVFWSIGETRQMFGVLNSAGRDSDPSLVLFGARGTADLLRRLTIHFGKATRWRRTAIWGGPALGRSCFRSRREPATGPAPSNGYGHLHRSRHR